MTHCEFRYEDEMTDRKFTYRKNDPQPVNVYNQNAPQSRRKWTIRNQIVMTHPHLAQDTNDPNDPNSYDDDVIERIMFAQRADIVNSNWACPVV